jgi:hypothetical protein
LGDPALKVCDEKFKYIHIKMVINKKYTLPGIVKK